MGNTLVSPSNNENKVIVPLGAFIQRSWNKKKKVFCPPEQKLPGDMIDLESLYSRNTGSFKNCISLIISCLWNKYSEVGWKNCQPNFTLMNSLFNKNSYSMEDGHKYPLYSIDRIIKIINRKGFHLEGSSPSYPVCIKTTQITPVNYSPKKKNIENLLYQGNILLGVVSLEEQVIKDILFEHKNKYNFSIYSDSPEYYQHLDDVIAICGINKNTEEIKIKFWWCSDWLWIRWSSISEYIKEVWMFTIKENIDN